MRDISATWVTSMSSNLGTVSLGIISLVIFGTALVSDRGATVSILRKETAKSFLVGDVCLAQ